jgi:hypothetical protein
LAAAAAAAAERAGDTREKEPVKADAHMEWCVLEDKMHSGLEPLAHAANARPEHLQQQHSTIIQACDGPVT